jgi:hypothetical protein
LLRLLALAIQGRSADCVVEADHLHNLPAILQQGSLDFLTCYWQVERPAYLKQVGAEAREIFDPHWRRIAKFLRDHACIPLDSDQEAIASE